MKVRSVAGYKGQLVNLGSSREEGIHGFDWPPRRLAPCHQLAACVGDSRINAQNPSFESHRQLVLQPCAQLSLTPARGYALDTIAQFRQSHHAEKHLAFVCIGQSRHDARIGAWLHPF